jgi:hypothetical protein
LAFAAGRLSFAKEMLIDPFALLRLPSCGLTTQNIVGLPNFTTTFLINEDELRLQLNVEYFPYLHIEFGSSPATHSP